MHLPLSGIRIVDVSSVVMGPLATQILADLGAEVIIIEDRRGDTNRAMAAGPHDELSGVTLNLLRNKRSIGLDIKADDGYAVFRRLMAQADVFVTNLRPGSRRRARITQPDIAAIKPDVVYCAAAGYSPESDAADAPAYDDIIQAASGFADLARRAGQQPNLMPTLVADKVSGLAMAQVITAALFHRERTGEGRDVSLSMLDVMKSFVLVEHGARAIAEPPQGPPGYPRILNAERRPQQTSDGWIDVLPYDDHHYQALFRLADRDDLIDERIASRRSRIDNGPSLYRDVAEIMLGRSTEEWLEVLRDAGIPATRVATLDDLVGELPLAEHPHGGTYRVIPPLVGGAGADVVRRPAPLHGEHGREVLTELGYSSEAITNLEQAGTLYAGVGEIRSDA